MSERSLSIDSSALASRMRQRARPQRSDYRALSQARINDYRPVDNSLRQNIRPTSPQVTQKPSFSNAPKKPTVNTRPQNNHGHYAPKPQRAVYPNRFNAEQPAPRNLNPSPTKVKKVENRRRKKFSFAKLRISDYALIGMASLVFLFGVAASINSFITDKKIAEAAYQPETTQTESNEGGASVEAEESKPNTSEYVVAPDMPRYLHIPRLDVFSRIKPMGLDGSGALAAPSNIHDAGWFNGSVKPGSDSGASIIDGHISGPYQKGVFANLTKLNSGDKITVEMGDGQKVNYQVVSKEVKRTEEVDMKKMMQPVTLGKHGINLISCTGKYNKEAKQYEERVMVYAEEI